MVLPAAEGAAQIETTSVAGIGEKADPAVATLHDAAGQVGTAPQSPIQDRLILTNKRIGAIVLVPILGKGENLLDGYGKKARFSVMMRSDIDTSSSYPLDAKSSRGGARIFLSIQAEPRASQPCKPSSTYSPSEPILLPSRPMSAAPLFLKGLLGKEKRQTVNIRLEE
jgi:hypothetical protein